MEPLARTERRIASLQKVSNVVAAMRSLAALRVQEGRQALGSVDEYVVTVDRALAAAVPLLAPVETPALPRDGPIAVIVFGSEHGFVGAFNDQLLAAASRHARAHPKSRLMVVGTRSAALAIDGGASVAWTFAMATRAGSVVEVARRTADEVYRAVGAGEIGRVVLVYAASEAGVHWTVQSRRLLPFDPAPYRRREGAGPAPFHYLAPDALIMKLVEELVFAELIRAALKSFASEHAARLATMETAHHVIEEKLQILHRSRDLQRQDKITTELLDIIAGAEALDDQGEAAR